MVADYLLRIDSFYYVAVDVVWTLIKFGVSTTGTVWKRWTNRNCNPLLPIATTPSGNVKTSSFPSSP
jgi:hypothetical protein